MKKKVAVLGATGSIGSSALDVIRVFKDDFEPVLFTANKNRAALDVLALEFPGVKTVLGSGGLEEAIKNCGADIFVHGIAGSAGLGASLAALETGAKLALANKESVVMAWHLIQNASKKHNAMIIPVDSEHSAVFNLINAHCKNEAPAEIILTASGGPFRRLSAAELERVTLKDALAHPTWNMGVKITIDSATLANKGLEVIEAARLFSMPAEKISVTVHPQSIVHSLIRVSSGGIYAELSMPDMRLPLHNALFFPEKRLCPFARLDFDAPQEAPLTLGFEKPDMERFPMLKLAYYALRAGMSYSIVYNAANEAAVALFCEAKIPFTRIHEVVEDALMLDWQEAPTLEAVLDVDKKAREHAFLFAKTRAN
ncbi:MAG: 1-deoxy-D-xylulose-5-phosphate reductoisomerase [Termitinemataceae bacterium]|nr:MAG: 1-deoxy-D-xylulose-5-phosphate reductoisomerase [Termitinemataceae bacterium]